MNSYQQTARNSLISHIASIEGSKAVIWDKELMGPFTLLRFTTQLKENNVTSMHCLSPGQKPYINTRHVIFIVRPNLSQMDLISEYIHGLEARDSMSRQDHHILFVPRSSQMCERRLKMLGVLGSVQMKSLDVYLFPLDGDIFSMEMDSCFQEFAVEKDPSKLMDVALALKALTEDFGTFPFIIGQGQAAKIVIDLYKQVIHQEKKRGTCPSTVHRVILIDRKVDLITPLATQLTYEGLIDEIFGIESTVASFPPEAFPADQDNELLSTTSKKLIYLNSSDQLYNDLRDRNFNGVGPVLSRRAMEEKEKEKQIVKSRGDKTIENIKRTWNQAHDLSAAKVALSLHNKIGALVKEHIDKDEFLDHLLAEQEILRGFEWDTLAEGAIHNKMPVLQVLRLLCLQSVVRGGLKPKTMEYYMRELVQTYGINLLIPLSNLEKAGLLKSSSTQKNFTVLKKLMKLITENDSEIEPTDICYTHSIYAPLSIRLVQALENQKELTNMKDAMQMMEGPTVQETFERIPPLNKDGRQVILVFFIGGCTYSEVSALRFLSRNEDSDYEYIIATTKIINGKSFLKSVIGPGLELDTERNA